MTAPVPVTPTEAREAAERVLDRHHRNTHHTVRPWCGVDAQAWPCDTVRVARALLAALPAEPAVPATFQQDQNWNQPTEDDTERVERVARALFDADGYPGRWEDTQRAHGYFITRAAIAIEVAALSPAQPDPATVERARAEGREQGLREAEQAVRDAWVYGHPVLVRAYRDGAVAAVRALSSATPSAPEETNDRG